MNRAIALLVMVFGVQVAITAHFYWPDSGPQIMQSVPLALLDPAAIDEIHVADDQGNETRLKRTGNGWLLPELDNLPADEEKVDSLLHIISSTSHGAPVADTVAARQRFRVASYHYQRHLTFLSEGKVHDEIYLGTSPGFRRVHARNDTSDAIYSIPFNTFDASGIEDDWLNRSILQLHAPDLIEGPGFALVRDGSSWVNQNGGLPEARELEALLRALSGLQIDGVADEDGQRSIAQLEPSLTLTITAGEQQVTLDFFTLEADRYILSSEHPIFFKLATYDYDRLLGFDPALLARSSTRSDNQKTSADIERSDRPEITTME